MAKPVFTIIQSFTAQPEEQKRQFIQQKIDKYLKSKLQAQKYNPEIAAAPRR